MGPETSETRWVKYSNEALEQYDGKILRYLPEEVQIELLAGGNPLIKDAWMAKKNSWSGGKILGKRVDSQPVSGVYTIPAAERFDYKYNVGDKIDIHWALPIFSIEGIQAATVVGLGQSGFGDKAGYIIQYNLPASSNLGLTLHPVNTFGYISEINVTSFSERGRYY